MGFAFFDQPATSAGAFTRGGVIATALMTVCFDAFGEVREIVMFLEMFCY